MEPQLIDYYNEMPSGANVIDKMNKEFLELQKKYDKLNKLFNKYRIPCFKVDTVEEYNKYEEKLENFTKNVREIIKDENYGLMSVFYAGGRPVNNLYELFEVYKYKINGTYYYNDEILTIEDKLVDELNKLTEYKNNDWSSYRVRYTLKEVVSNYNVKELSNLDIERVASEITDYLVNADATNIFDPESPIMYCNYIPENCYENEKEYGFGSGPSNYLYNIVYYNCEICNKLSRYGDPKEVDNKLLCEKCHLNTLYPGEY